MKQVLLMVVILMAGCATQTFVDPLTRPLGWSEGSPEVACADAISNVRRVLKEQMPGHYSADEVQYEFERNHRLVAIWRTSTRQSEVYDFGSSGMTFRQRLEQEKAGDSDIKAFQLINGGTCAIVEIKEK